MTDRDDPMIRYYAALHRFMSSRVIALVEEPVE